MRHYMRSLSVAICLFAFALGFVGCDTFPKPMWHNPTPGHGSMSGGGAQPAPIQNGQPDNPMPGDLGGYAQPQQPHIVTGPGSALPAPRSY